jgi:hypothetical protein
VAGTIEELTVNVANVLVEIDLGVVPLAVAGLETGPQDMAVVDSDVLSGVVESHLGWCWVFVSVSEGCYGVRQVYDS